MIKINVFILLIAGVLFSCTNENNNSNNQRQHAASQDTITTSSGLKYIYLKKGNRRKIEFGSAIQAYAYLHIEAADTALWSTFAESDSLFSFIHEDHTRIQGFIELNNLLVEGDEVVAILPASLAYGEGDSKVPPGATLIYDPYRVLAVSEPKINLGDTLYQITTSSSAEDALAFYEHVTTSDLKDKYHTAIDLIYNVLFKNLRNDGLFPQMEVLATYFQDLTTNEVMFKRIRFVRIFALIKQGKTEAAIAAIEPIIKEKDAPAYWQEYLINLRNNNNESE